MMTFSDRSVWYLCYANKTSMIYVHKKMWLVNGSKQTNNLTYGHLYIVLRTNIFSYYTADVKIKYSLYTRRTNYAEFCTQKSSTDGRKKILS